MTSFCAVFVFCYSTSSFTLIGTFIQSHESNFTYIVLLIIFRQQKKNPSILFISLEEPNKFRFDTIRVHIIIKRKLIVIELSNFVLFQLYLSTATFLRAYVGSFIKPKKNVLDVISTGSHKRKMILY